MAALSRLPSAGGGHLGHGQRYDVRLPRRLQPKAQEISGRAFAARRARYRGDGLRNSATTGGNTTTFTWDINAGLPEVLDDGSHYVYGAGLISQVAGANTCYYLPDGLGSVIATTDSSGNVVNSYTYNVHGATTSSPDSQANDRQFAEQEAGPTGLQYLRARYLCFLKVNSRSSTKFFPDYHLSRMAANSPP